MVKSYLIPIVALVAVVGGVAWLVQYLPRTKDSPDDPKPETEKKLLEFTRTVAEWEKRDDTKLNPGWERWKYVEKGDRGHYDFLFKNTNKFEVELAAYHVNCDCTTV